MEMLCKTPFSNICQDPVPQYLLTLRASKIAVKMDTATIFLYICHV